MNELYARPTMAKFLGDVAAILVELPEVDRVVIALIRDPQTGSVKCGRVRSIFKVEGQVVDSNYEITYHALHYDNLSFLATHIVARTQMHYKQYLQTRG